MTIALSLLGQFSVRDRGRAVDVAPAGQQLLALIALRGGSARRSRLAGTLWPERSEKRSLSNLRGVLWRLPDSVRAGMSTRGSIVEFGPEWSIDLARVARAAQLAQSDDVVEPGDQQLLHRDLLPDWDMDWLLVTRERHRQLRLHALEQLAQRKIEHGDALDAVDLAMAALADEPLRESAQLLVLRAHLAAGNRGSVIHEFERFQSLLRTELDVGPSQQMLDTVALAHE